MNTDNLYKTPAADLDQGTAGGSGDAMSQGAFIALRQTKPWVLLIAVVMLLLAVLMAFIGVSVLLASGASLGVNVGAGVVYFLSALAYALLGISLIRYGTWIGRAVQSQSAGDVESALLAQKAFWKAAGLLVLVFVVIFFVATGAALLLG